MISSQILILMAFAGSYAADSSTSPVPRFHAQILPILQANTPSLLAALEQLSLELEKFRLGLEEEDAEALKKLLEEAKTKRDGLG